MKKKRKEKPFDSKSQQRFFWAKCNDETITKKERDKWCKWADTKSDVTNFNKIPDQVEEDEVEETQEINETNIINIIKHKELPKMKKSDLIEFIVGYDEKPAVVENTMTNEEVTDLVNGKLTTIVEDYQEKEQDAPVITPTKPKTEPAPSVDPDDPFAPLDPDIEDEPAKANVEEEEEVYEEEMVSETIRNITRKVISK